MREVKMRLRDTPVAVQATKEFWARKREEAKREATLVQQPNGDWL